MRSACRKFPAQANPAGQEDFLKFLLGEIEEAPAAAESSAQTSNEPKRLRLYDDKRFLLERYRCLTDDPEQVELAIKAARNTSGHWSREFLCTDQQPILQWITERLLMLMKRGECPHITSRSLEAGELCFCFIGQVSSRAGAPLVVDSHAVSFRKGGGFQRRSLRDALDAAGFERLVNEGKTGNIDAIKQPLIEAAVEASLDHMRSLAEKHVDRLLPYLRREERRLRDWKTRRQELLESRLEKLPPNHRKAKMYRRDLEEMDAYLRDRQENWRNTYFTASTEPSTQLVLVIEGVN